jgi:hypothetical protein
VYPALHTQATLPAEESAFVSHTVHDVEPSGEKVLGGQEAHNSSDDMVDPAGHVEHSETEVAAMTGKCLPAGHATHEPDTSGHDVQLAIEDAPIIPEYFPIPQGIHVSAEKAPFEVEYVPARHVTHNPSKSAPLEVKYVPALHCVHAEDVEPTTVEYVPTSQSEQPVEAFTAEYFPATQTRQ